MTIAGTAEATAMAYVRTRTFPQIRSLRRTAPVGLT